MSNSKISALTSATTPLAGTEVLPIVQSSATVKVATNDLTVRNVRANATTGILQITGPGAGTTRIAAVPDANFTIARTDAGQSFTGDQTLATGNLIQGTAAKGVNFTANTPAAGKTSQLLNWYEEGTWTPNVGGTATYTNQTGKYTRIGRVVHVLCDITINVIGTGSTSSVLGLPFAAGDFGGGLTIGYFTGLATAVTNIQARLGATSTSVTLTAEIVASTAVGSVALFQNGTRLTFSGTYNV